MVTNLLSRRALLGWSPHLKMHDLLLALGIRTEGTVQVKAMPQGCENGLYGLFDDKTRRKRSEDSMTSTLFDAFRRLSSQFLYKSP